MVESILAIEDYISKSNSTTLLFGLGSLREVEKFC